MDGIYIYRSLLLLIQIADPFAVANSRGRSERDWTSRCAWHVKQCHQWIWVFPKVGVPQNGTKWMVCKENAIKMEDLGVRLFLETPIFCCQQVPTFRDISRIKLKSRFLEVFHADQVWHKSMCCAGRPRRKPDPKIFRCSTCSYANA